MGATTSVSATRLSSPTPRATVSPPKEVDPGKDVEQSFREFRESAVRLVERVNDLTGTAGDPVAAARNDVRLVRSIFGKWSAEILVALHAVPSVGFEELRRNLPGISPRVLSLKLKGLEQNGMVHREIIDTRPPRVRYALTDRGWTVAWLAHPVFLYLRHLGLPALSEGADTESDTDSEDL